MASELDGRPQINVKTATVVESKGSTILSAGDEIFVIFVMKVSFAVVFKNFMWKC